MRPKHLQRDVSWRAGNGTSNTAAEFQNTQITAEILTTFLSLRHNFLAILYLHIGEKKKAHFYSKVSNRAVLSPVFNHIQVDRITCSGGFSGAIYIQG